MLQQLNGAPVFVLGEGATGGSYLSAVSTDESLTGNGTVSNPLSGKPLTGQTAPISETRATATYTGAANAGFTLYSKLLGTAGNAITYTITTAADDNLAISVTGNAITIALANTTSSKNTATLVKAAIEAKAEANAIVAVVLTGTGAGIVATQSVASLTGGLNGTAGYQGQVIYDTSGNEWRMIWTNGTVYYWALPEDCYPALDTEYVSHYCSRLAKVVYKMAKETTTASAGGIATTAHGIVGFLRLYHTPDVLLINGVGNNHLNYYFSSTDFFTGWVNATNCQTNTSNNAALNSKTVYFKFKYIKV